ncbi:MAG: hypothetical protein ACOH19_16025 [Rhodoglobus sp.]
MKNRDWIVLFAIFFAWVLAQSLLREWVGAAFGLIIGLAGLAAIAGGMWLVLRRRKARALAGEMPEDASEQAEIL